jgi:hypothetical protein
VRGHARVSGTTIYMRHMYRHCSRYAAPRAHLTTAICDWYSDAAVGGARPTREDALRWIHENTMADDSSAPPRWQRWLWKEARKLRWVCKGVRGVCEFASKPTGRNKCGGSTTTGAERMGGPEDQDTEDARPGHAARAHPWAWAAGSA